MAVQRIPLVGSLTNRKVNADTGDTADQTFINCFPDLTTNPITRQGSIVLNKRPGAAATSDVQASAIGQCGSVLWSSNLATGGVSAPVVMSFRKSTGTSIMFFDVTNSNAQVGGDVASTNFCTFMSESDVSGTPNLTATLRDSTTGALEAWFYPSGGAWTQITDGDFPTNITASHAHLDGFMFVMTVDAKIYNSDLNSLSSWNPTNYITASSFADRGVGCVRYNNLIFGLGDFSGEFFYNAGNTSGSVLSRIPDSTISVGAMRTFSTEPPAMRCVGNTVYWIGQDAASGTRAIYRLKGMQAEKISNVAIDKMVSNGKIRYILGSFALLGMTHVAFNSETLGNPICYCAETGFWWHMTGISSPRAFVGAADVSSFSKSYLSSGALAKVFSFDPSSPLWADDFFGAHSLTVRTQNMDMGTRRIKFWRSVGIIGDIQSGTSNLSVQYSDNDYGTTSTARTVNLSINTPVLKRLGASRRRSWTLTHSANTPCRIEALEIDYDVGQH